MMPIHFSSSGSDAAEAVCIPFSCLFCSDFLQVELHSDTLTAVKKVWGKLGCQWPRVTWDYQQSEKFNVIRWASERRGVGFTQAIPVLKIISWISQRNVYSVFVHSVNLGESLLCASRYVWGWIDNDEQTDIIPLLRVIRRYNGLLWSSLE